jgi:hypothetical protein
MVDLHANFQYFIVISEFFDDVVKCAFLAIVGILHQRTCYDILFKASAYAIKELLPILPFLERKRGASQCGIHGANR